MREYEFRGYGDVCLQGRVWEAEGAKVNLVGMHGLGEHAGRYARMAEALQAQGISLWVYDQRGHGKSGGKRGVARLDDLARDALAALAYVRTQSDLPIAFFGHSMGGGAGLYTLVEHQPDVCCAIITSPWLRLATSPPVGLLKAISGVPGLFRNANMNNGIDAAKLCKDTEVTGAYVVDPLNHSKVGLLLAADLTKAAENTIAHAGNLTVPLLLLHGGSDGICAVEGSRAFAQAAGDKCEYHEFPGMLHELHNEPGAQNDVFALEAAFIRKHLG